MVKFSLKYSIMIIALVLAVGLLAPAWDAAAAPKAPAKVAHLKATARSSSQVRLKWKKMSKVKGFQVYRKTSHSKWKKVRTLKSGKYVAYTDKKLKGSTKYRYKIRAFRKYKAGKKTKYKFGKFSKAVTVKTKRAVKVYLKVKQPKKVDLDVKNTDTLKVTKKVSKAAKSKVKIKFKSSDKRVLTVSSKGKYTAKNPGRATVTVRAVKDDETLASKKVKFTVNGLCLDSNSLDYNSYFYKGKTYMPGELSPKLEAKLCFNVKDVQVYLNDYLPKYQKMIKDPTEATLTAMMNYSAKYMHTLVWTDMEHPSPKNTDRFIFDPRYQGDAEDCGQTFWVLLAEQHVGACVYYSSYFSYLSYLSGASALQIEDEGHDWNLIYHDSYDGSGGYYYNLENHYLLCVLKDKFVAPPFNVPAAKYFKSKILTGQYKFPLMDLPLQDVSKMGRDLSERCPVLMCENTGTEKAPEYRVSFKTLKKGQIPKFSDGKAITLEDMAYLNMQVVDNNEEIIPLFSEASRLLQNEVRDLFTAP